MKTTSVLLLTLGMATAQFAWAQEPTPDVYTPADLAAMEQKLEQKAVKGLATETIKKYSSDYTTLAFRSQSGQAEQHEKFADFYVVIAGEAKLVSGGQMVNGKSTAAGELRGDSIQNGKETTLTKGDVVHIPANIPHQLILAKGATFKYFVIKVQEVE
jgi:mannose-6-phosphate isomerase-like protein (cupin superfamily)